MKEIYLFILFVATITLAGIGIEDNNTIAFVGGIVAVVLTLLVAFSYSKEIVEQSKNS